MRGAGAMIAPLVTCIVPVFNGERYLAETLACILSQTYGRTEVVVIDDGSTDASAQIALGLAPRVHLVRQPNAGPAAARNRGVGAASGELVAFLDQDDLWHAEKLERQVARFAARPELDACVTHARNFWTPELHEASRQRDDPRLEGVPAYVTSALMVRRTLFERIGGFDPALTYADDTEWFLRAADREAVVEVLPEVLTYHRMHESNLGHARGDACRREYLRVLKQSLDRRRVRAGRSEDPCP